MCGKQDQNAIIGGILYRRRGEGRMSKDNFSIDRDVSDKKFEEIVRIVDQFSESQKKKKKQVV